MKNMRTAMVVALALGTFAVPFTSFAKVVVVPPLKAVQEVRTDRMATLARQIATLQSQLDRLKEKEQVRTEPFPAMKVEAKATSTATTTPSNATTSEPVKNKCTKSKTLGKSGKYSLISPVCLK